MPVMSEKKFTSLAKKLHSDIISGNTSRIESALVDIGYHKNRIGEHVGLLRNRVTVVKQEKAVGEVKQYLKQLQEKRKSSINPKEREKLDYRIGWIKKEVEKKQTGLKLVKDANTKWPAQQKKAFLAKKETMLSVLDNLEAIGLKRREHEGRKAVVMKKFEANKVGFFRKRKILK